MTKNVLAALALLATAGAGTAQTGCPPPVVKVLCNNQEVPPTGAPIVPYATIVLAPSPDCPDAVRYEFNAAELTLMRGPRPYLPTKTIHQPHINMLDYARNFQPGDRLYVFVLYENLLVVSADGKRRPYSRPKPGAGQQKGIAANLLTDDARGIGFSWLLLPK